MNDFTKDELGIIAECVEADFYHTNWSKSMYEPLIKKIQSLINNYCEHEPSIYCKCEGQWVCDECHFKEQSK